MTISDRTRDHVQDLVLTSLGTVSNSPEYRLVIGGAKAVEHFMLPKLQRVLVETMNYKRAFVYHLFLYPRDDTSTDDRYVWKKDCSQCAEWPPAIDELHGALRGFYTCVLLGKTRQLALISSLSTGGHMVEDINFFDDCFSIEVNSRGWIMKLRCTLDNKPIFITLLSIQIPLRTHQVIQGSEKTPKYLDYGRLAFTLRNTRFETYRTDYIHHGFDSSVHAISIIETQTKPPENIWVLRPECVYMTLVDVVGTVGNFKAVLQKEYGVILGQLKRILGIEDCVAESIQSEHSISEADLAFFKKNPSEYKMHLIRCFVIGFLCMHLSSSVPKAVVQAPHRLQHAMKSPTLGAVLYFAMALSGAAGVLYFDYISSSWGGGFPTARRDQRREQQNHRTHMRHAYRWVGGVLESCQTLTVAKLSTLFALKSIEKSLRVDTNQQSRPYVTMQGRSYYILYELLKEGSIETYFPATMKVTNVVASTDSELEKVTAQMQKIDEFFTIMSRKYNEWQNKNTKHEKRWFFEDGGLKRFNPSFKLRYAPETVVTMWQNDPVLCNFVTRSHCNERFTVLAKFVASSAKGHPDLQVVLCDYLKDFDATRLPVFEDLKQVMLTMMYSSVMYEPVKDGSLSVYSYTPPMTVFSKFQNSYHLATIDSLDDGTIFHTMKIVSTSLNNKMSQNIHDLPGVKHTILRGRTLYLFHIKSSGFIPVVRMKGCAPGLSDEEEVMLPPFTACKLLCKTERQIGWFDPEDPDPDPEERPSQYLPMRVVEVEVLTPKWTRDRIQELVQ